MKNTLMASNISSTLLPSILTAMTLQGHDCLQQEGHCRQTFMEIMQACGSEMRNAALLPVFCMNQSHRKADSLCGVVLLMYAGGEMRLCLILKKFLGFISHHICATR